MNPDTDTDTDTLAAETRRLLDAATELTAEWYIERTYNKRVPDHWSVDVLSDDDHVCSVRGGDEGAHALAALIAAAPRLLANWLARNEQTEAVEDDLGRIANENAALAGRLIAERDRLADENRALRDERDRYRQHSVLLNRVSWKLLQATGRVGDGDDKYEHESEELCLEMVAELVEKVDAAQLQSIEARDPGIDMDKVRASRAAAADRGDTDGEATDG